MHKRIIQDPHSIVRSKMSTNDQNEIPTTNLNKPIEKTLGSKEIQDKVIHVCGRSKFRGKPSPMSSADKIGEDGKEEKYTISTVEQFELEYRDEGKQKISTFFVSDVVYGQVGRLADNIDELFQQGKHTGPLVLCKKQGKRQPYWMLLSEEDFEKSDDVVRKEAD